jgi:hypothetical protein
MMHGHEKSDPAIVAGKPAKKPEQSRRGAGGAKGRDRGEHVPAKHALDSAPSSRGTGAGTRAATALPFGPEVGAVCGKAARTDLDGGAR